MSVAPCPVESYTKLFIVVNHSHVIHPIERRELPQNMTVATLSQLNQTIHLRDGRIPTEMFRSLFNRFGPNDIRGFPSRVLPTDSDVMRVLSQLRHTGMVFATHHGQPQPPCQFRQRKHETEMTVQMCFLPGGFVHSAIYEFSLDNQTGVDVSDAILVPNVNPGMQLYRETTDKDRVIIDIEKRLMPGQGFIKCPDKQSIIQQSGGRIVEADIDDLHKNREQYKSAIQFRLPIDIFCSYDIADVEMWRSDIVAIILSSPRIQQMMKEVYNGKLPDDKVFEAIIFNLKRMSKRIDKLTIYLIYNAIESMQHGFYDHKTVTTGHAPLRSDELFHRIRKYSGDEKVYVVFIGCRHVPSSDPAELAVMHSPRSSKGSKDSIIDFGGGIKRRTNTNKSKSRKTLKKMHKKRIINRSHYRK